MKTKTVLSSVIAATFLAVCVGCGKSEPGANTSTTGTPAAEKSAVENVVQKAADQVKDAAANVTAQAQQVIDQAKTLVTQQKYQEALDSLKGLTNLKLTPEQDKMVADIKKQIQDALTKVGVTNAASAATAVGNLLKK